MRYKGKDVENAPYKEKLEMLREISQKVEGLDLPPLYRTPQEKKELLREIIQQENPLTREGIVSYKLNEPLPYKSKGTEDYDMKIVGTYPAEPGSKYDGNAIGGFIGIPEGSKTRIRVGSGLSDELRKDAYENPSRYIGQWARFTSRGVFPSGKHQAPTFKDLRPDKFPSLEKEASLIAAPFIHALQNIVTRKKYLKPRKEYLTKFLEGYTGINRTSRREAFSQGLVSGTIAPDYDRVLKGFKSLGASLKGNIDLNQISKRDMVGLRRLSRGDINLNPKTKKVYDSFKPHIEKIFQTKLPELSTKNLGIISGTVKNTNSLRMFESLFGGRPSIKKGLDKVNPSRAEMAGKYFGLTATTVAEPVAGALNAKKLFLSSSLAHKSKTLKSVHDKSTELVITRPVKRTYQGAKQGKKTRGAIRSMTDEYVISPLLKDMKDLADAAGRIS